jgi:hypothetical protein
MLSLVTARARTKGKTPKEFTFQAVGRLSPRKVNDKDNNPILVDAEGNQVKYTLVKKDGKDVLPFDVNSDKEPIAPEGTRFIEVDDILTTDVTEKFEDVLELFGSLSEDERGYKNVTDAEGKVTKVAVTPLQMVINSALDGYNYNSRKNAAPVTEQVTEDELTPITLALVAKGILNEQDATTWRRNITGGAKLMEQNRLEFAQSSPQYKRLIKAGWAPTETAA